VTEADKPGLSELLNQIENWLYDEGQDTIKSVYIEKLDLLRDTFGPIENRCTLFSLFPERAAELRTTIENALV
jgi:heat shock protein 4